MFESQHGGHSVGLVQFHHFQKSEQENDTEDRREWNVGQGSSLRVECRSRVKSGSGM